MATPVPNAKKITCDLCGAKGLVWGTTRNGTKRMCTPDGKVHVCYKKGIYATEGQVHFVNRDKFTVGKGKDKKVVERTKPKPVKAGPTGMIMTVPPPPKAPPKQKVPDEDEELARVQRLEELEHQAVDRPKRQIFDNEYVTQLCVQFKMTEDYLTYEKICAATSDLMDAIIRVNKFQLSAPFEDIKNHLFLQFRHWIRGVKTGAGSPKVYTYFSTCIKNGALSYIGKEKQLHDRMIFVHDTPLEAFNGMEYVQDFDFELRQSILESLKDLEVRWNEPIVREIIKYLVVEIVSNKAGARRQQILRTITSSYPGISMDTAKFLLDWTQGAIRMALLEKYTQPLGEIDVMRVADKFSFVPDIVNCIGLENAKKLMSVFAGITIRFPSHTQLRRYPVLQKVYKTMEQDPSPDAVTSLASHLRTSPEKVQAHYENMQGNIAAGLLQDAPLYDPDDEGPDRMVEETFEK